MVTPREIMILRDAWRKGLVIVVQEHISSFLEEQYFDAFGCFVAPQTALVLPALAMPVSIPIETKDPCPISPQAHRPFFSAQQLCISATE
jgi:hypothetical protein